jgi:hypothetical protein
MVSLNYSHFVFKIGLRRWLIVAITVTSSTSARAEATFMTNALAAHLLSDLARRTGTVKETKCGGVSLF